MIYVKQKTEYEIMSGEWESDVCSTGLVSQLELVFLTWGSGFCFADGRSVVTGSFVGGSGFCFADGRSVIACFFDVGERRLFCGREVSFNLFFCRGGRVL